MAGVAPPPFRRCGTTAGLGWLTIAAALSLAPSCGGADVAAAVALQIAGPAETVFSWRTDRCDDGDIPDAPARAFRDASGQVHLIASHHRTRALIGPGLGAVKRDCRVVFQASGDDDHDRWDDRVWLTALFTPDGRVVQALGHAEYHGHRRPSLCRGGDYKACWRNAVIQARSDDGGASFRRATNGGGVVAAPPGPFDASIGRPIGYFSPSNIVTDGGYHYVFVFAAEHGAQRRGACLLRSADIADPAAWRAWDGRDFTITLQAGNSGGSSAPQSLPCAVIPGVPATVGSVSRIEGQAGFVAVIAARRRPAPDAEPIAGIYALTSPDLLHWSEPRLLLATPLMWARGCADTAVHAYPALLDEDSRSRNFETVSGSAGLYLTRFAPKDCRLTMDRDLVRYPVEIGPRLGATPTEPR
jgi:hypothetical protein